MGYPRLLSFLASSALVVGTLAGTSAPASAMEPELRVTISGSDLSFTGAGQGSIRMGATTGGRLQLTLGRQSDDVISLPADRCGDVPGAPVCLEDRRAGSCEESLTLIECEVIGAASVTVDRRGIDSGSVAIDLRGFSSDLMSVTLIGNDLDNGLLTGAAFDDGGAAPVLIEGGEGADRITVQDTVEAAVLAGPGDDILDIDSDPDSTDPTLDTAWDGGSGDDLLTVRGGRLHSVSLGAGPSEVSVTGVENLDADLPVDGALMRLSGDDQPNTIRLRISGSASGPAILSGAGGDDIVAGLGRSSNLLDGGEGDDVLVACESPIALTPSEAVLQGATDNRFGAYCAPAVEPATRVGNELRGGAGADLLIGGYGGETMNGGPDFDVVSAQGHRVEVSPDVFTGVTLDFSVSPPTTVGLGAPDSLSEVEGFEGTIFDDVFRGSPGPDFVQGAPDLADRPLFVGGLRALVAESSDTLIGNGGDDVLRGSLGDDVLTGGPGDDVLTGDLGSDTYRVGDGEDQILEEPQNLRADGTLQGPDPAEVDPETGFLLPRFFDGDTVSFRDGPSSGVVVFGDLGTGAHLAPGGDTVVDTDDDTETTWTPGLIEKIIGTDEGDYLRAAPQGQQLVGLDGDDLIEGGPGSDQVDEGPGSSILTAVQDPTPATVGLSGGPGDDELLGGPGPDVLSADSGADTLDCGGDPLDNATYEASSVGVRVTVNAGGGDDGAPGSGDTVLDCGVTGSPQDDVLVASPSPLADAGLFGLGGNDVLEGGPAAETLSGGPGQDAIDGRGGADTIEGGPDGDDLVGGSGRDSVRGQSGSDTFTLGDGEADTSDCNAEDSLFSFDRTLDLTTGCAGADDLDPEPEPGSGRPDEVDPRSAVSRNRAKVEIGCDDPAGCSGRIDVVSRGGAGPRREAAERSVSERKRAKRFARTRYSVREGRTKVVTLKLNRAARKILRKRAKLRVKVVVRPSDGSRVLVRKVVLRVRRR